MSEKLDGDALCICTHALKYHHGNRNSGCLKCICSAFTPIETPTTDPTPPPAFLTDDERAFVEGMGKMYNLLYRIAYANSDSSAFVDALLDSHPSPAQNDLREGAMHVHALQNMVLANAAARAYPDTYRLLGQSRV